MRRDVWRVEGEGADAVSGRVEWAPAKSLWNSGMVAGALILGPVTATPGAVAMFVILTYATLLLGHSVGMHRYLIHRAFDMPRWLARTLVYLGVLVGMAGPYGILRIHDLRDWAQRLPACHDFFSHRRSLLVDALWQLHCRFSFERPPALHVDRDLLDDPWLQWMERTWMLQQAVLAVPLYWIGGWSWVVWGVCCRVSVSVAGHWIVTYYCHNPGAGQWHVKGAGVQAANLPGLGFVTLGECWHNNHHAFPESARMGLEPGEIDPGYWVIERLRDAGLAWNIGAPRGGPQRDDLTRVEGLHGSDTAEAR
ncbi:acyl-CoA desaturase [Betaproteobacteria bacterium GR16-43]|nr:acyl-CoA desaturase [Betaproteobacteria bacterium GR16-43]